MREGDGLLKGMLSDAHLTRIAGLNSVEPEDPFYSLSARCWHF